MAECKICGEEDCDRHGFFIGKPVEVSEFSGASPPEIFVGRWNYPNVYTGILSPKEYGDTRELSSPEIWHARKSSIAEILNARNKLIYGRTQSNIKKLDSRFLSVLQDVAMTQVSVATEFHLKKPIIEQKEQAANAPLISHAAEVAKVVLQENPKVEPYVEYLVGDDHALASEAMKELDNAKTETSSIIKLLSAGLLGRRRRRKLVPTRWSITAVDDILSKQKLEKIRYFPEIVDFELFHAAYLGNHYEFILLPGPWSFEVIEISLKNFGVWQDNEGFYNRKRYAQDVTGAYYANRLAVCEYLERCGRQASVLVFREIRPEYTAPLGVGILRQTSRAAFQSAGEKFGGLAEALASAGSRLRLHIDNFSSKSKILGEYRVQKKLSEFF